MTQEFDAAHVARYHGKKFTTSHDHTYGITEDGRFTGRPSIEGAKVLLIAGVEDSRWWACNELLGSEGDRTEEGKQKFDNWIRTYGRDPEIGLSLVIAVTAEDFKAHDRYGLLTTEVVKIE
jgi:hypothetical protein